MKKFFSADNFKSASNIFATVGTFDGCHLGHRSLFNDLKKFAYENNAKTLIFTFWPHPRSILSPDFDFKLLNNMEEKIQLFDQCNIDNVIIEKFSRDFSRISPLNFIRDVLINKLKISGLVIGYNHHFGRNREGSYTELKDYAETYGFKLYQSSPYKNKGVSISSTKIRNYISQGELKLANSFLGYNYFFTGKVIKGEGLGVKIGYPTANILVADSMKLIPNTGVYAVKSIIDSKEYLGMMNIGYRPTFKGKQKSIEVNLFNLNQDLYDRDLKINVLYKIRDEIKFDNIELLKNQISNDKKNILSFLKNK